MTKHLAYTLKSIGELIERGIQTGLQCNNVSIDQIAIYSTRLIRTIWVKIIWPCVFHASAYLPAHLGVNAIVTPPGHT